MSWSLVKSRNLYYGRSRDDQISYWARWDRQHPGLATSFATGWEPSRERSNCPGLASALEELVELLPAGSWRERIQQVFVARIDGDEPAEVVHNEHGAYVAVSSSFLDAMFVYAQLHHLFLEAQCQPSYAIDGSYRDSFKFLRTEYDPSQRQSLATLEGKWPLLFPTEERRNLSFSLVSDAERWTVAHELAHEVLRSGSSRYDRDSVTYVDKVLARPEMSVELRGLGREKRWEIQSDILALEIIAGDLSGDTNEKVVSQAVAGALLTLVTLGDLGYGWTNDSQDSHPGSLLRMTVALKWVTMRFRKRYPHAATRAIPWLTLALALEDDATSRVSAPQEGIKVGTGKMVDLMGCGTELARRLSTVGLRRPQPIWGHVLES